ncbi:MAG: methyltransferase domain-containing protein [Planctomycetota bacterium]|nr:methyltransferase domain-containing protein [Planctomycetota bacterium]MDA1262889.1 methyltransferase domain-containing protein [Planctomycetota bacterium]
MLKFVHQAIRDIRTTGSVFPSSRALANAMTRSLRNHRGEKRILEVGPGTGPFTSAILDALRGHDSFDIVEVNTAFCTHLEDRMLRDYRARHPSISVKLHAMPIEQAPLEGGYDFVICGLPFNNFPLEVTQSIFNQLIALMRDGGEMTYFEYAGVRTIKHPFIGAGGRDHIRRFEAFRQSTAKAHIVSKRLVVANFPPAHAMRIIKRQSI